jgi:dephospho-CoA kinase
MITLGLTGGIGMGKTTAAEILAGQGIPVVDTDQLARDLVAPGQPALEEIRANFGSEVTDENGSLRRAFLADLVFTNPVARKRLEAILHPRIRLAWRAAVAGWEKQDKPLAVVVIPLLFEVGTEAELDVTLCIGCTAATQRTRLEARGWSAQQMGARLAAQWPIEKKLDLARYAVWNEGSAAVLRAQLERVVDRLVGWT